MIDGRRCNIFHYSSMTFSICDDPDKSDCGEQLEQLNEFREELDELQGDLSVLENREPKDILLNRIV